ncbi:MAG: hypothetical protein K1X75_00160 [Leptospirales bacterium]|nr:hypothetical protein [Leptospirales bacterium]
MDLEVYRILHIASVVGVCAALGGVALFTINGGQKANNAWRRPIALLHGIGLALLIVSGFGMLHKLGLGGMPPLWAWLKIVLWLLLGGALAMAGRKASLAKALLFALPLIAALAAYLGIYRPF